MSLRFVFGPSGAGKSTWIRKKLMEAAAKNPEGRFYLVVPDQYTLSTQKEMVLSSPTGGILNIDVLSFGRLSHRVLEETGGLNIPVLDDTGKNLVLRLVAEDLEKDLPLLGPRLKRPGYIHEVKSAISEFMQYGISVADLDHIIEAAGGSGALQAKLKELQILYGGFQDYIRDHYITTEETLDVVAAKIPESEKCRGAEFVFDGFTGFTPIQIRVIEKLLMTASRVTFSLILDGETNPYAVEGDQKLFALSQKTVKQLQTCAEHLGVSEEEAVYLTKPPVWRFEHSPELAFLEKNLFRYNRNTYDGEVESIRLTRAADLRQEVRHTARTIRKLLREEGYEYRDMAVVCGDLEAYAPHIRSEFSKLQIPFFLDRRGAIGLNPFVEFIKSALQVMLRDFSVDSVSAYLRSGMTGLPVEDADLLEQYLIRMGIQGKKKWSHEFTKAPGEMKKAPGEEGTAYLLRINEARKTIFESLAPLEDLGETASSACTALMAFIERAGIEDKLSAMEDKFAESGDAARQKEYHQIYGYIVDMVGRIGELLGEEVLSLQEFSDLLDAGFTEMKVGVLPGGIDRLLVGDMERSRLNNVKVLFFLGINDGNIPGKGGNGGIISDPDREYLAKTVGDKYEFAPSPRQKMFIQRLYLYMNLTKPSEKLYLSFSRMSGDGDALRPAYLVESLRRLFPKLKVEDPLEISEYHRMESIPDGRLFLADELRRVSSGESAAADQVFSESGALSAALSLYEQYDPEMENLLLNSAFARYRDLPLEAKVALALYGEHLKGSVSRLEKFAECPYAHFLSYGLRLREKQDRFFESRDMGSILHEILQKFSKDMSEAGYTLVNFPEEKGNAHLKEIVEAVVIGYGEGILYDSKRNTGLIRRIERIAKRTLDVLQYQLLQGDMIPAEFEKVYVHAGEQVPLKGIIDRLDKTGDGSFVKILDYKSGDRKFNMEKFYNGIDIQLMAYLSAALAENPKAHPAGVLYYHLDDPMVEANEKTTDEQVTTALRKALRMHGVVSSDDAVRAHVDKAEDGEYKAISLNLTKEGKSRGSNVLLMGEEDMKKLSRYADKLIEEESKKVLEGVISVSPYKTDKEDACTYCPFKTVCGYDEKIPGYCHRELHTESGEKLLERIRKEVS